MCNKIIGTKVYSFLSKQQRIVPNIYGEPSVVYDEKKVYIPVGELTCPCKCLINIRVYHPVMLFPLDELL